jgi:release factor glutamine methyltransferase
MLIRDAVQEATERLAGVSETPLLDVQVLLADRLGVPRTWVMAHPEGSLAPVQLQSFHAALQRLEAGEPLPYVTGHWEFYGLDFSLTPDVLIPRPETELLVERALDWLRSHPGRRRLADIGTGSGCIAVSLAISTPDLILVATDISPAALEVARSNARKHGVADRIEFVQADLLEFNSDPVDLLAANLPYIPSARLETLAVAHREPRLALDGGPDGMDIIRRLLAQAPALLSPGGLLLLEMDALQEEAVRSLTQAYFPHARIRLLPDLAGLPRLVEIESSD